LIASAVIAVISLLLFVYWFRYTCLLILSAKTARDYARDVAAANQLSFVEAQSRLAGNPMNPALEQVHEALERDYRLVVYLLRHAANYHAAEETLEHWILRLDYRFMCLKYHVTRAFSLRMARGALLEMAAIINHMANNMGERVAVSSRA
jgi:hypothetical protein